MDKEQQERLDRHLELCREIFLDLKAQEKWPWPNSPKSENLLESEDKSKHV